LTDKVIERYLGVVLRSGVQNHVVVTSVLDCVRRNGFESLLALDAKWIFGRRARLYRRPARYRWTEELIDVGEPKAPLPTLTKAG
jgi:hypothetical protein